jgi:hypothetical protein
VEVIAAFPVQAVDAEGAQEPDVASCRLRRELRGQPVEGLRAVSGVVKELAERFADIAKGSCECATSDNSSTDSNVTTLTFLSCHPAGRVVAHDLYIRPARDDV